MPDGAARFIRKNVVLVLVVVRDFADIAVDDQRRAEVEYVRERQRVRGKQRLQFVRVGLEDDVEVTVVIHQQHIALLRRLLAEHLIHAHNVAVVILAKVVAANRHDSVVLFGNRGNLVVRPRLGVIQPRAELRRVGNLHARDVVGRIPDGLPPERDSDGIILIALQHAVFLVRRDKGVRIGRVASVGQAHRQGRNDGFFRQRRGEHQQRQQQRQNFAHRNSSSFLR